MEQRSRALLIGVGAFESEVVPDLPAVEKDLGSMKAALTNEDGPAFSSTEVVENPAGCDLRRAIEAFFLRAGGDARLNLLYLASHARVDEQGTLQLLPSDFDPSCPLATAVPVTFIGECMQHCGPQATVILLDCCFAEAGMWRLLEHRKDLLQLREHAWPSYCVIAATRSRDTAADGAFARYFVEALDAVDPEPDEESVGAVRIYDYVVTRLRDRHMQVPRLWQSRSFAIPLGRRSAGLRATREAVEEMYAFVTDRKLEALPQPDACGLDFIERRAVGIGNLVTRTGIRILGGTPSLAEVEAASAELAAGVGGDTVDQAALILSDSRLQVGSPHRRVAICSFADFRRDTLPLIACLEREIAAYESELDGVYRNECYVSVYVHQEGSEESCLLDEHLLDWSRAASAPSLVIVLGEFGAGKTTTARYVFWRQAKRFLESQSQERIPIFVNLRDFSKAFDIESLLERSLRRVRAGSQVSTERLLELNKRGRVLWILDGFDEMAVRVTETEIRSNFDEILKLVGPRSRLLLTSRGAYFKCRDEIDEVVRGTQLHHQLREVGDESFQILNVEPFRWDEIETFVRARVNGTDSDGGIDADGLLETLESTSAIRELASRPILLEMIVVTLPRMLAQNVPINISNIYRSYTDKLLLRDAWKVAMIKEEDRRAFCRRLAWRFFETSTYSLAYRDFPQFIKQLFPDHAQKAEEWEVLVRAVRSTSFLRRDDAGNFSFTHKSFLEYFVAEHLAEALQQQETGLLSQKVLPFEIQTFLAELLASSPPAGELVETLSRSTRPSLSGFLRHYLAPRMLPVLSRTAVSSHVQRARGHLLVHLIAPALVFLALYYDSEALPRRGACSYLAKPWGTTMNALLVSLASLFVFYAIGYIVSVLRGREGDPIQRFNASVAAMLVSKDHDPKRALKVLQLLPSEHQDEAVRVLEAAAARGRISQAATPIVASSSAASEARQSLRSRDGMLAVLFPVLFFGLGVMHSILLMKINGLSLFVTTMIQWPPYFVIIGAISSWILLRKLQVRARNQESRLVAFEGLNALLVVLLLCVARSTYVAFTSGTRVSLGVSVYDLDIGFMLLFLLLICYLALNGGMSLVKPWLSSMSLLRILVFFLSTYIVMFGASKLLEIASGGTSLLSVLMLCSSICVLYSCSFFMAPGYTIGLISCSKQDERSEGTERQS